MFDNESLEVSNSLTTDFWDNSSETVLGLDSLPVHQTLLPDLYSSLNEYENILATPTLFENEVPLELSFPSSQIDTDLRSSLEQYFARNNWQSLIPSNLPQIQVVPAELIGDQPAAFDALSGGILIADSTYVELLNEPETLAEIVLDILSPENLSTQISLEESANIESSTLDLAINQAEIYLSYLFSQSDWLQQVKPAFGSEINAEKANEIAQEFLSGKISLRSLVQILPENALSGKNGAFNNNIKQIYLSEGLINQRDPGTISTVLLEEFGHYLDEQINTLDSPGDEGELFAHLVQKNPISESDFATIKADNDHAVMFIDGEEHVIEYSTPDENLTSGPDLAPITATTVADRILYYSGTIPVSYSIGNFGDQKPTGHWHDNLYASDDPFFDDSDIYIHKNRVPFDPDYRKWGLKPGEYYSRLRWFDHRYSWRPRKRFLLLVTDAHNRIAETNETNNVRIFEVGPLLGNFDNIPLPSDIKAEDIEQNSFNYDPTCDFPEAHDFNSDVELHSGAVVETHELVSYSSLGNDRGLTLRYNSLHADPRPILHFGYSGIKGKENQDQFLVAKLSIERGEYEFDVPGYVGDQYGLSGGEHFWRLPQDTGADTVRVDASLQFDLSGQQTGIYNYQLKRSIQTVDGDSPQFSALGPEETGEIAVINRIDSIFGSGWSIDGWKELIINPDQSVLLVDGSGLQRIYEAPQTSGGTYVSAAHDSSILEKLSDGTFRISQKDKTIYRFNARNQLAEMQTTDGELTRYEYDAEGRLTAIVDPVGLNTTFTYAGKRVSHIIDPAGRMTELTYDEVGNLIRITDPDGAQRNWDYDEQHHMVAEVDARGYREESIYDFAGRAVQATRKDGSVVKIDPVAVRGLSPSEATSNPFSAPEILTLTNEEAQNPEAIYTDGNGNIIRNTLNQAGQTVTSSDDVGLIATYERNDKGQVTQITNARGFETTYLYDDKGNITEIRDSLSSNTGQQFTYDSVYNQVTSTTDELGNLTLFDFDSATGNLLSATRVVGDIGGDDDWETQFSYLDHGLIDTLTDPLGRITDFDYDAHGRIIRVTYAKGTEQQATEQFEYDLAGNQTATIDANGHRTELEYDASNRVIQIKGADPDGKGPLKSPVTLYTYDSAGNLVATTDALGNETRYEYDAIGQVTRVIEADPDGKGPLAAPVTQYSYDLGGNLVQVIDANQNITGFDYDARNRLIAVTDANGGVTQYTYDLENNLTSALTPLGYQSTWEYDARNRQVKAIDPLGNVTRFAYNAANQLVQITDAENRTTQYRFDALDRLTQVIDPLNQLTTFNYDKVGNLTAVTDVLGRKTQYEYDALNRRTGLVDFLDQRSSTIYDPVGNVISTTDALNQTTRYGYDALNRLTSVTDPLNGVTRYDYDANGNLLSLTDPEKNRTSYRYDYLNRVIEDKNASGDRMTYGYDAVGNLVSLMDRNKRDIVFGYDALNRNTHEQWLGKKDQVIESIEYAYDADSRLTSVQDSKSSYSYIYDAAGRLTSADNQGTPGVPNVTLEYRYDAVGNRLSTTDTIDGVQGGSTSYRYDALDRMTQIEQTGLGVSQKRVNLAYDAIGNFTEIQRFSDLSGESKVATSRYEYDTLGRLTHLSHGRSDTIFADYRFIYDAMHRLTQFQSIDGTSTYSYDANDQITEVDHSDQADESYSYDVNGNRTDKGYKTTKNNQLKSDDQFNYHYDKQGNLIRKHEKGTGETTKYAWDYRNRLTEVVVEHKGKVIERVEYLYDAFDRRIGKIVDIDGDGPATGETERFVYDGAHIALVFDQEGNQTHRYLYGPQIDQILADETVSGEVRWALSDHQGSVRDVIDDQGQVLNHIVYDSFGNISTQTNSDLDFRFGYTGREFDAETGLQYYRARYYDARTGRFISEDPIEFAAGDANLYRYVGNSPTNYTDPTGNFSLAQFAAVSVSTLIPITISGAFAPDPVQAPANTCDIDHTDNSGRRAVIELVTGLGIGIFSTLARRALTSILDELLTSSSSLSASSKGAINALDTTDNVINQLQFASDELIYGPSANGALKELQTQSGGQLLSDFLEASGKDVFEDFSGNWKQASQWALEQQIKKGGKINFDLTNLDDLQGVLNGTAYPNATTSFELRYLQMNWSRFKDSVIFIENNQQVSPW